MVMNSQIGFSLVEMMVAIGLVGGLGFSVMKIMDVGLNSSADLTARQESQDLRTQFQQIVRSNSCGIASDVDGLKALNITVNLASATPVVLPQLMNQLGDPISPNLKFGKYKFDTNQPFTLSPVLKASPLVEFSEKEGAYHKKTVTGSAYYGELGINLIQAESVKGNKKNSLRYLVAFSLESGKLSSCLSISSLAEAREVCEAMMSSSADADLEYKWNKTENKCEIIADFTASSGSCMATDPCNTNPALYNTSSMP